MYFGIFVQNLYYLHFIWNNKNNQLINSDFFFYDTAIYFAMICEHLFVGANESKPLQKMKGETKFIPVQQNILQYFFVPIKKEVRTQ